MWRNWSICWGMIVDAPSICNIWLKYITSHLNQTSIYLTNYFNKDQPKFIYHHFFYNFFSNLLLTAWMYSRVLRYEFLGTSFLPRTQMAKSFVIYPFSTASIVDCSSFSQKSLSSGRLSSLALWRRPLVQAKIEAIELVEVSFPFWCWR